MKRFYFVLLVLSVSYVKAQTLTYANYAKSISTTTSIKIGNVSSFSVNLLTLSGTGVTWDASGITQQNGTPIVNMVFRNPNTTANGNLYPNSNYAVYDPALITMVGQTYYGISADSVVSWGDYEPSSSHSRFQNPDKRLIFPFSVGQTFTDTYAKTNYSNATTISSYQTGIRTVNFKGFGTLILPQGTFLNVGCIYEVRTNSLGPNSSNYTWYYLTNGSQLMYYAENNGKVSTFFNGTMPSAASNLTLNKLNYIYPNPAKNSINVDFPFEKYSIYNLMGQIQVSGNKSNAQLIDISDLKSGIYFIELYAVGEKYFIEKLIVE